MKRYIIIAMTALCTLNLYAQSSMTDSQVLDFVMQEHKKGTSQAQIVTKLMQNGVNINQIRKVRRTYEQMQRSGNNTSTDFGMGMASTDRTRSNNGNDLTGNMTTMGYNGQFSPMDQMQMMGQYSNGRISGYNNDNYIYDETDPEFMQINDELNDWMPVDTATMYKNLLAKYRRENNIKKVFGRDIFNRKDLTFEPAMNIATPQNYVLGPGDDVYIDVYGASQKNAQATVTPDGTINIENFGPIQVGGLTVAQATARVRQQMGKYYNGSKISLTLGQTRTITVNIMGEVKKPGSYTLSAFGTVFHALHMAGGVSNYGTLRNIKVYRKDVLISVVDVYDYMLNGKLSGNVRLSDNDVIVVGAYDNLVRIVGKVKRPMWFEMKNNESLGTLLRYAGGFTGDAYKKSVRVFRKNGQQLSIHTVNEFDMGSFTLTDEDSISVDSVIQRFENMVEVKGAVFRPGMYQVGDDINSVRSLLEAAEGTTEYAFTAHALLHRKKKDRRLEVIAVDIDGIMEGSVPDIPLQNEDVLFIPTRQDVQENQTLSIRGEVQYPGIYQFAENTTLEDLVLQAGGLKESASTIKVEVSRRIVNPKAEVNDSIIARTYTFALKDGFVIDGDPGFILAPFDEVYVHQSPGTNVQKNVTVDGEVMFAGVYTLPKRNARLSDIIKAAGGVNDLAYVKGARLERKTNEAERLQLEDAFRQAKEQQERNMLEMALGSSNPAAVAQMADSKGKTTLEKFAIPNSYPVGIELDKALAHPGSDADIVLRDGDRIIVPEYNGTVRINGAVMHTNTVGFVEGKSVSYYIDQAGGFSSDAKKRNTYILYMNGMVAKVGHNAKVRPGCEIIVPTKAQSKMTIAEKMTMATSFSSIATMMATVANILK